MRVLFLLLFSTSFLKAQLDSAITVPLIGINFGAQMPSGDLVQRFGPNLSIGLSFLMKTKKNWVLGVDASYLFGRNVNEDVLSQLRNETGAVVDNEGFPADIRVTERGFIGQVVFGRVFKFIGANPNSGLMVNIGLGYMQHRIHFYDAQQRIAAVNGDLVKGYDRLTNGLCVSEFIGYLYLSENRIANFYFGIESFQGSTQSVRKVNYDTGLPDTETRTDILTGFRLGWILPLYKKTPNDFYYD